MIAGMAEQGPAARAGLQVGDLVLAVADREIEDLAGLFRKIWSLGPAGVEVPLRIGRDGRMLDLRVASADRNAFLKGPSVH